MFLGFLVVLSALIFTTGCGSSSNGKAQGAEGVASNQPIVVAAEKVAALKKGYAQKLIPLFVRAGYYKDIYRGDSFLDIGGGTKEDCIGLVNGNNDAGDLITTLANDTRARQGVFLRAYTTTYLTNLKRKVDLFSTEQYQKDFFGFYTCHITTDTDVVAGYVWDKTIFPYNSTTTGGVVLKPEFKNEPVFLLVHKNSVHELKNISIFTAPDQNGEVSPCEMQPEKNRLKWFCYAGSVVNEEGISKPTYKYWFVDFEGKVSEQFTEQSKY
jgi:hypothetical protein